MQPACSHSKCLQHSFPMEMLCMPPSPLTQPGLHPDLPAPTAESSTWQGEADTASVWTPRFPSNQHGHQAPRLKKDACLCVRVSWCTRVCACTCGGPGFIAPLTELQRLGHTWASVEGGRIKGGSVKEEADRVSAPSPHGSSLGVSKPARLLW